MMVFGVKLNKRGERVMKVFSGILDFFIAGIVILTIFSLPEWLADALL